MKVFWQHGRLLCEPAAKVMEIRQTDGQWWESECLGKARRFEAADLQAARVKAMQWLSEILTELQLAITTETKGCM